MQSNNKEKNYNQKLNLFNFKWFIKLKFINLVREKSFNLRLLVNIW